MSYSRRKSKKVGRTILFLLLTILFGVSTGVLAYKLPQKAGALKDAKAAVASFNEENEALQTELNTSKATLEQIQQELKEKQEKLAKVQAENPNISLDETSEKYAYLTFDDGPSTNTIKILDFLKANNIKATFFVLGKENQDEVYKRIVNEGHTLALHSNTHEYQDIYKSVDSFMADITALSNKLEAITGVKPTILRFPGGSNNTISHRYGGSDIMQHIIPSVVDKGYLYFDWNVDSLDAAANKQDKNVIVRSVLEGARGLDEAVILMHDATPKTTTVEALPEIVQGLREQGFSFRPITSETQQVKFK